MRSFPRPFSFLLALFILFLVSSFTLVEAQETVGGRLVKQGTWKNNQIEYVDGLLAVKLKVGAQVQALRAELGRRNASLLREFDKLGWALIGLSPGSDSFAALDSLLSSPLIEAAELQEIGRPGSVPNDPYFSPIQWALQNTGYYPGSTAGADIHVTQAWDITQGSLSVTLAILDTGIPMINGQLSHPDLNNATRITPGPDVSGDHWSSPQDVVGHGTHVTGIAAAETNNSTGIAGVAGGCKVLVVKISQANSNCIPDWVDSGVVYAVDNGARVINISYQWDNPSTQLSDAMAYANAHGVLVVACAGNGSQPIRVAYPAAYSTQFSNVIAVAATQNNDNISIFSNYGPEVTVVAPGGAGGTGQNNIYSTAPNYPGTWGNGNFKDGLTPNYGYLCGTSQATPMVAGTAALILSINPGLTPSQVRTVIEQSADWVYHMVQRPDPVYGYGRLNAYSALKYTLTNYGGTLSNTLTIPQGESWTFQPGVTVLFAPGTSLTVNGMLTCLGDSLHPVTFDRSGASGTWGGITFNSGISGSISYCRVRHADRGIYENGVMVNVTNCAISGCTNGIYLYNASSPAIQNCNIHDNTNAGVYCTSSSPNLNGNNNIQNNAYGLYCTTNSNPKFGTGATRGMNNVTGNTTGVYCWNNSLPMLGQSSPASGGYDNLTNTSWNVTNMTGYAIYGQNNWWGSTNPSYFKIGGTGSVVTSPWLGSALPIPSPPLSKPADAGPLAAVGSDLPLRSSLDSAYQLVADGRPLEARRVCLNLVTNYPPTRWPTMR